ncbi:MAG: PotD/PotF family extracellular solute-binding protein [Firmicutes bacterium]|nr:PotD/PotF family extracellular solute-binding protein [Bacillota bacterium]
MTKRTLAILMVVVLVAGGALTTWLILRIPRSQTLRIYNWDYFIDEALLDEFATYWRDRTGQRFRIVMDTFPSNEHLHFDMNNNADFDLIVPSDYMLERMIRENMVRPLDMSRLRQLDGDTEVGIARRVAGSDPVRYEFNPAVIDPTITAPIASLGAEGSVFGVPYLYGTMGIMFDTTSPDNDLTRGDRLRDAIHHYGWASLWAFDEEITPTWVSEFDLPRNISMSTKNIGRENFTVAQMARYREELLGLSGQPHADRLNAVIGAPGTDDASFEAGIVEVQNFLERMNPDVVFEHGDQSLEEFLGGTNSHLFGMEWSVSAAFTMLWDEPLLNVEYHIPAEGTNVWINNLAIPTGAVNVDAAYAFINWISRATNAERNMAWAATSTPIIAASNARYDALVNGEYFDVEGMTDEWRDMYLRTLFPSRAIGGQPAALERAAIMRDFGTASRNNRLGLMMTNWRN